MTKKMKLTKQLEERKLFETWLDIYYADQDNKSIIKERADMLKGMKKHARKTAKSLLKVTNHYKELYGKDPMKSKY